jgi:hypothetical protein
MRLDMKAALGEAIVTLGALFLLVAAVAGLRIACCLDRVDAYEITSVAAWRKIATRSLSFEISTDPATLVAVKAVGLRVTLSAVVYRLACKSAMIPDPVCIMIGSDTFAFVTRVAFTYL